jgi:choline dehydrogenase-like flavoprotein
VILARPDLAALRDFAADVCVIGSGPVGVATALALAGKGFRVLVLESGGRTPEPAAEDLARAENLRPDNHFEPHTAVGRRLGGSSSLWAGRCVPFDPIDFRARPWLGLPAWPITEADLAPYLAPALEALAAGAPVFEAPLGLAADPAFRSETLERWSNVPKIHQRHGAALAGRPDLLVALHATVLGFRYAEGRIAALELHLEAGRGELAVSRVVLAAGGNASTRLLLLEQARDPRRFGGPGGPLGRGYMGHLAGQIADIVFDDRRLHDGLDYHVDAHGSYVRRRLVPSEATQAAEALANIAFWPVVPPIANAAHRSGPLSAVFLALSAAPLGRRLIAEPVRLKHVGPPPYRRAAHLRNVLGDLPRTLSFAPAFLWKNRVAKLRLPGFFLRNPARRYGLEYHGEQLPDPDSRLTLGDDLDRLGQRRLRIDLRFSDADAASILRAHAALDAWLTRNRLARLDYYAAAPERAALVLANARDGAHQVGTLRMAADATRGLVDGACRSFEAPNLFVVSTAVLPSSGQANPTLTAVQLGLRLADALAAEARN